MIQTLNKKYPRLLLGLLFTGIFILVGVGTYNVYKPLPDGLSLAGQVRTASEIAFYRDLTWVDAEGRRHSQQEIFDKVLKMIAEAKDLVVLDMFLFNDFMGRRRHPTEALHRKLQMPW